MQGLPTQFSSALDYALSVRGSVSLLGKVALGAMAYFAVRTGYIWTEARNFSLPALESSPLEVTTASRENLPLSHYDIVLSRNIFGVRKAESLQPEKTPVSPLSLRLVATHVAKDGESFAIIEQKDKKTQDVFDLKTSSNVFGQGKLTGISEDSVKIDRNGQPETLKIEEGVRSSSPGAGGLVTTMSEDQREFTVSEAELNEQLANLPQLISQARAVPYFRNGASIGMRLFAIRRGSLYEKLGLRNGDIVKSVNDASLADPAESIKIFERLKSERDVNVSVERAGQEIPLHYRIQ